MSGDEKYWLIFFGGLFLTVSILTGIGTYAGYLNDQRDAAYTEKGLQPYRVEHCTKMTVDTEWHEAGWKQPTSFLNTK